MASGVGWNGIFRIQSQPPLSADDRNDGAAVSVRDDLALSMAGRVARGGGAGSDSRRQAASGYRTGAGCGRVHALRRMGAGVSRVDVRGDRAAAEEHAAVARVLVD